MMMGERMKRDTWTKRRELLQEFARVAKMARSEGDLDSWRIAANEWRRLATPGEIKRAPDYLGLH
jgi:hypothetical protein